MNLKLHFEHIRQLLNISVNRLDQPVVDKLRDARMQALARYDARVAAAGPVYAVARGGHHFDFAHHKFRYFAAAALLAAALTSGITYWHHEHDVLEVDVAILTDELPIELYVD